MTLPEGIAKCFEILKKYLYLLASESLVSYVILEWIDNEAFRRESLKKEATRAVTEFVSNFSPAKLHNKFQFHYLVME